MNKLLAAIFLLAILLRFLYFPDNIYFGFDQARDAFASQQIYKNIDIKLIGPSTAVENLFHGPFYWYLIGPFYLVGFGNPAVPAGFLLVLNALGIFVIFWLGKQLFNPLTGAIAAFLYAVSYEQTQYALYFGNPAPAVLTILFFYTGLAVVIFRKKWIGLPMAFAGFGLSIQFEFFLVYLAAVIVVMGIVFRKEVAKVLSLRAIILSFLAFIVAINTFIVADLKYEFRAIKTMFGIFASVGHGGFSFKQAASVYFQKLLLHIHDNILASDEGIKLLFVIFLGSLIFLIAKREKYSGPILFVFIWFLSSIFLYVFGIPSLYYSNIGISPALLLLVAHVIYRLSLRLRLLSVLLLLTICVSNVKLILEKNSQGITYNIYVQTGMLLSREKRAIDYMYHEAAGKPFVVSALTMPLKVNTTWAYLFNWYGGGKYGYVPYWSGEVAVGYPGNLPLWKSQEQDYVSFSIVEPTRGVRGAFVDQYLADQEQYGTVIQEKNFGDASYAQLIVQKRAGKGEDIHE